MLLFSLLFPSMMFVFFCFVCLLAWSLQALDMTILTLLVHSCLLKVDLNSSSSSSSSSSEQSQMWFPRQLYPRSRMWPLEHESVRARRRRLRCVHKLFFSFFFNPLPARCVSVHPWLHCCWLSVPGEDDTSYGTLSWVPAEPEPSRERRASVSHGSSAALTSQEAAQHPSYLLNAFELARKMKRQHRGSHKQTKCFYRRSWNRDRFE